MGWPGPRRRTVPLRLSEEEERPVRELAETLPYVNGKPNLSAAIRQIIAEWDDQIRPPRTPPTSS
jgi:hypothetical protein